MRDLDEKPYSADEKRVAKWWCEHVGGGDDPIGALIASHELMAHERKHLKDVLRRFRLHALNSATFVAGAANDPIWAEVAEAIE